MQSPQEALQILRQVGATVQANLETHQQIQNALQRLERFIVEHEKPVENAPAEPKKVEAEKK